MSMNFKYVLFEGHNRNNNFLPMCLLIGVRQDPMFYCNKFVHLAVALIHERAKLRKAQMCLFIYNKDISRFTAAFIYKHINTK